MYARVGIFGRLRPLASRGDTGVGSESREGGLSRKEADMPRRHSLSTIGLLACVIAIASALSPGQAGASSDRTIIGGFPIAVNGVFEPESSACGFLIIAEMTGEGRFQVFLDADGNFLRAHVHLSVKGTLTANGLTVHLGRSVNQFFEADGAVTEVGLVFRDSAPGVGVVLMDRGRLVFDPSGQLVFEAGPHPQLHGDFGELCSALTR